MNLRARVTLTALMGLGLTQMLGRVIAGWLPASGSYPQVASAIFVAAMLLVIAAAPSHHPFPRFGAANLITTLRLILTSLSVAAVLQPVSTSAAWLVVSLAAALTLLDGADGWLARRTGLASALGARFDVETDALFILTLSVLVWRFDKAGAWVLGCGLMRYAFVASGRVLPWMAGHLTSTMRGKTVAVAQLVGLSVALSPLLERPASAVVAAATLLLLGWSFAIDVRRLWDAARG
jgi:phosphatidylglycerophosphate synthase